MTILEIQELSVRYAGITAVENATLSIAPGELIGIIGPNGAGKTSLLNAISGIVPAATGAIILRGHDITNLPLRRRIAFGIARTFQSAELFPSLDVIANLMIGRHHLMRSNVFSAGLFLGPTLREEVAHREKVEEVIEFLNLQRYRKALVGSLPFGLQKIIGLGRALCAQPEFLLIDEVASGLTHDEKLEISDHMLRINERLKITIIWVEHDVRMIRDLSTRVVAFHYGRQIANGPPEQVLDSDVVRQSFFGFDSQQQQQTQGAN
jgi:branched-chain amino acid transport system ATP-binding protein